MSRKRRIQAFFSTLVEARYVFCVRREILIEYNSALRWALKTYAARVSSRINARAVAAEVTRRRCFSRRDQTASDCDVKWNCFTLRAGVNEAPRPCVSEPLTRSGAPIISTFPGASNSRMLWLKRKLRIGY